MSTQPTTATKRIVKAAIGTALAAIAVAAVAVGLAREFRHRELARVAQSEGERAVPIADRDATIVYYFHTDVRCDTCLTIEQQTEAALRLEFASELESGRLRFRAVNFDAPEHRHFRDEFDLSFGSVVVANGGEWENLGEVWTLVHDERAAFDNYLVERIRPYLRETP